MSRQLGTFNFNNNLEVGIQGPLDARSTTPSKSQLTNGSLPQAYIGMLVVVTSDGANNGLYRLTAADATNANNWEKVGGSEFNFISNSHPAITMVANSSIVYQTQANANLFRILFASNGV